MTQRTEQVKDNPAFRVILRMEIRPEAVDGFERTWLEVGELIAKEPANLGQVLVRGVEERNVYYVITDWTDEPSFRRFERSELHVQHRRRLAPYRTGGEMAVTEVVYDLRGARASAA
ncbi:antibiotic biosynthesis monooxygenase [Streptomyces sp. RB6PN25]|uniref:Antibiotic biosynthesis monooxygenase n=1 Tax=Streptomyces humicola TaxID=2953240 RepID=A0ABT1Q2Q8_9ACTN|nr:antibiotic biosynthesis monooxygenase family protein [Streptomyces humicola]MCQ4084227.1 antibiotic biosynthesis monooxygenase [Streptomyces humicola]